jgi:prepilin-type N-terminal cleavage/methylation domain-containing protein
MRVVSHKSRATRHEKGFSLLEITIALVLLTVGLTTVLHLFPAGLRAGKRASYSNEAAFTAQEQLAEVKRVGVAKIEDWLVAVSEAIAQGEEPPSGPILMKGHSGRMTWEIKDPEVIDVPEQGLSFPNDLRRITVVVNWVDQGKTQKKEFATYVNR